MEAEVVGDAELAESLTASGWAVVPKQGSRESQDSGKIEACKGTYPAGKGFSAGGQCEDDADAKNDRQQADVSMALGHGRPPFRMYCIRFGRRGNIRARDEKSVARG